MMQIYGLLESRFQHKIAVGEISLVAEAKIRIVRNMNNTKVVQSTHLSGVYVISAIHRANRQALIFIDELIRDSGVSAAEGHLMSYVRLYGPSTVGELVRVFGYRKPTMSSMINKLEKRGYLRRLLNAEDKRSLLVELTPKGRELSDACRAQVQGLDAAILEQVTEADLQGFQRVLTAVTDITGIDVKRKPRVKR
jgi:DNA-binding MarR family transcriptional regulator